MKRLPIFLLPIQYLLILPLAVAVLAGCPSNGPAPEEPGNAVVEELGAPASAAEREQLILQRRIASAEEYFREGRYEISRQILKGLPDPAVPQAQLLQARIALAQEDSTLAVFYLKRMVDGGYGDLTGQQIIQAHELLAELSYEAGDLDQAYRSYLQITNMSGGNVPGEVWTRLAQIALFHRGEVQTARVFMLNTHPKKPEDPLMHRLSKRLSWGNLSPEKVGLQDSNISVVRVDGDDLWIGTWNGGISRYSISRQEATVFATGGESLIPQTVRSIEVTPARVWIGTYQGLYQYTKSSSRWQKIGFFDEKVEALCAVQETLYVGTLGGGLWRSRGDDWERIREGVLPGQFVNSLAVRDDHLLIGTLNLGLAMMSLKTGRIFSFDAINPNLQARNVIALLPENEDTLWIGTYGEGLYRWKRKENTIEHFSKASGEIADDWILCAVQAASGLYFGTFGGGVSRYLPESDLWERIGLSQGLSALDISSVSYTAPDLFFGTLGSGISVLDESLVLHGSSGIE